MEAGDEPPVEEAEQSGHQDWNGKGERYPQRRMGGAEIAEKDEGREGARNGHERADRQIDPAGRDDERHTDADYHDGRDLRQVDVQGLPADEVRGDRDIEQEQEQKPPQGAVTLEGEPRSAP